MMSVSRTASAAPRFDLAVVGAGIVGLAHALAAARAGLKVVVIERDLRASGASTAFAIAEQTIAGLCGVQAPTESLS